MENFIIECPECHANFYNINDSILQKCPVCKKIFNVEQLEESESPYELEDTKEEESESPYESGNIQDRNIPPLLAIIILLPFFMQH